MRIKCEAKRLLECISMTKIEPHGYAPMPKSGFLYLDAGRGGARASGYNGDVCVIRVLDAEVTQNGRAVLPITEAKRFLQSEKEKVCVFTDEKGQRVTIVSDDGHRQVSICRPEGKPEEPSIGRSRSPVFKLGQNFSEYFRRALVTVAPEESRPVLHGVLMQFEGERLTLAGADGFRLLQIRTDEDISKVRWADTIVPMETCQLVAKRMKGKKVSVSFGQDTVHFVSDGTEIASGTITGKYPVYSQIIWNDDPYWTFSVPPKELVDALGRFEPTSGIVRLYGEDSSLKVVMECEDDKFETCIHGKVTGTGHIAVNKRYLCDFVKLFTESTWEMKLPADPLKVTGTPEGMVGVLMPMFVQW